MSEHDYIVTVSFGHLTDSVEVSFSQEDHAIEWARKRLVSLRNSGRVKVDLVKPVIEARKYEGE